MRGWIHLTDLVEEQHATRRQLDLARFGLQAVVFVLLSRTHSFGVLAVLAFVVLLCYGGGFGTMPAFAADLFGPGNIGSIYGLMLTAWGFAGAAGPALFAYIRQTTGDYTRDLHLIAGVMLLGAVLPSMIRPLKGQTETVIRAPQPQYTFGRKR